MNDHELKTKEQSPDRDPVPMTTVALDLIRACVDAGQFVPPAHARMLLEHIEWLQDDRERMAVSRDDMRDQRDVYRRFRIQVSNPEMKVH
jgi:hypothetical protein